MKKFGKILLGIVAVIAIALAVVFYFTAGLVDTADQFFEAVKDEDMDKAYSLLSEDFKASTSQADLQAYLVANSFTLFKQGNWDARSINGGRGTLTGSITTVTDGVVPVSMEFVSADSEWKIYSIKKPLSGLQAESNSGQLPDEQKQVKLVNESMMAFVESVSDRDMSGFHQHISNLWQEQYSVEMLEEAFKQFYEFGADLKILKNYAPVFDQQPEINSDGVMIISGHYPTRPSQVYFTQKYIYEGLDWKLVGFSADVKD